MNITRVIFPPGRRAAMAAQSLWQWDYGQLLQIDGLELPTAFQAHFCNISSTETLTSVGTDGVVEIPDDVLRSGERILVYIYLHTGDADGETEYVITIPVNPRPAISPAEPTPTQQDAIDQAIEALNAAVTATDASRTAAEGSAEAAAGSAEAAQTSADAAQASAGAAEAAQRAAEAARDDAAGSAADAALSAAGASESESKALIYAERAEQAANTAGYLDVEIVEGRLVYTRTDAVDVDFELDAGHLLMEVI